MRQWDWNILVLEYIIIELPLYSIDSVGEDVLVFLIVGLPGHLMHLLVKFFLQSPINDLVYVLPLTRK